MSDPQYGERAPAPERPKPATWTGPTWFLATFLVAVPILAFAIPLCVWLTRIALGG